MVGLLPSLIEMTTLAALIGATDVLQTAQRSIEHLTLSHGNSRPVATLDTMLVLFLITCFPLTLLGCPAGRRLEP